MKKNRASHEDARKFLMTLFKRKIVVISAIVIVLFLLIAVFAPVFAGQDPYEQNLDLVLQDPAAGHLLGTDALGRDVFARVIYGSRVSIVVGVLATFFASVIGVAIGLIVGYVEGSLDMVVMRIIDAVMAIPPLVQAMVMGVILGGGLVNVSFSIAVSLIPTYIRIARGQVISVKRLEYVNSSIALGCRTPRLLLVHILPNCLSPLIVLMTQNIGGAMLTEANLSFLGLGIAPPTASWGAMVSDGFAELLHHPLLSIAPGVCVMLVVLAFNIVGDGLRDALDPRLRSR